MGETDEKKNPEKYLPEIFFLTKWAYHAEIVDGKIKELPEGYETFYVGVEHIPLTNYTMFYILNKETGQPFMLSPGTQGKRDWVFNNLSPFQTRSQETSLYLFNQSEESKYYKEKGIKINVGLNSGSANQGLNILERRPDLYDGKRTFIIDEVRPFNTSKANYYPNEVYKVGSYGGYVGYKDGTHVLRNDYGIIAENHTSLFYDPSEKINYHLYAHGIGPWNGYAGQTYQYVEEGETPRLSRDRLKDLGVKRVNVTLMFGNGKWRYNTNVAINETDMNADGYVTKVKA